ncbi:hypothetical protein ACA910_016451 [Epithemia clementina (nom. ined.)]
MELDETGDGMTVETRGRTAHQEATSEVRKSKKLEVNSQSSRTALTVQPAMTSSVIPLRTPIARLGVVSSHITPLGFLPANLSGAKLRWAILPVTRQVSRFALNAQVAVHWLREGGPALPLMPTVDAIVFEGACRPPRPTSSF